MWMLGYTDSPARYQVEIMQRKSDFERWLVKLWHTWRMWQYKLSGPRLSQRPSSIQQGGSSGSSPGKGNICPGNFFIFFGFRPWSGSGPFHDPQKRGRSFWWEPRRRKAGFFFFFCGPLNQGRSRPKRRVVCSFQNTDTNKQSKWPQCQSSEEPSSLCPAVGKDLR